MPAWILWKLARLTGLKDQGMNESTTTAPTRVAKVIRGWERAQRHGDRIAGLQRMTTGAMRLRPASSPAVRPGVFVQIDGPRHLGAEFFVRGVMPFEPGLAGA